MKLEGKGSRQVIVIFEAALPPIWKPGQFKSTLGGKTYRRFWWLCFSLSFWGGDLKEYGDAVRHAEWVDG